MSDKLKRIVDLAYHRGRSDELLHVIRLIGKLARDSPYDNADLHRVQSALAERQKELCCSKGSDS